eukprot:Awhi_evm1s15601
MQRGSIQFLLKNLTKVSLSTSSASQILRLRRNYNSVVVSKHTESDQTFGKLQRPRQHQSVNHPSYRQQRQQPQDQQQQKQQNRYRMVTSHAFRENYSDPFQDFLGDFEREELVTAFEEDGFIKIDTNVLAKHNFVPSFHDSNQKLKSHNKNERCISVSEADKHIEKKLCFIEELNYRLERVLRGEYSLNQPPLKQPKLIKDPQKTGKKLLPLGVHPPKPKKTDRMKASTASSFQSNTSTPNLQKTSVGVLQVINIHKSDQAFEDLVLSPSLGKLVAKIAGWDNERYGGARVAQDQVWAKPPNGRRLVYHRDSPYFMFEPLEVVTVWLALDDMHEELGPLKYINGSHKWGNGRLGSCTQFFDKKDHLIRSAAEREGLDFDHLKITSMVGIPKGALSIHNGWTWHGSEKNTSENQSRRGIGIHFVPVNIEWNVAEALHSALWRNYVSDYVTVVEDDKDDLNFVEKKKKKKEVIVNVPFAPVKDANFPITYRWEA